MMGRGGQWNYIDPKVPWDEMDSGTTYISVEGTGGPRCEILRSRDRVGLHVYL